jgi:hypothetical protein
MFYERSLNEIRESNAGDKLHVDFDNAFEFKGRASLSPIQDSITRLAAEIFQ